MERKDTRGYHAIIPIYTISEASDRNKKSKTTIIILVNLEKAFDFTTWNMIFEMILKKSE